MSSPYDGFGLSIDRLWPANVQQLVKSVLCRALSPVPVKAHLPQPLRKRRGVKMCQPLQRRGVKMCQPLQRGGVSKVLIFTLPLFACEEGVGGGVVEVAEKQKHTSPNPSASGGGVKMCRFYTPPL